MAVSTYMAVEGSCFVRDAAGRQPAHVDGARQHLGLPQQGCGVACRIRERAHELEARELDRGAEFGVAGNAILGERRWREWRGLGPGVEVERQGRVVRHCRNSREGPEMCERSQVARRGQGRVRVHRKSALLERFAQRRAGDDRLYHSGRG